MRYSKKRIKKNRTKRIISKRHKQKKRKNKSIKRQRGGGALKSMVSMLPFMSSEELSDDLLDSNPEISNGLSNQSVLVGALCNQYIKNNIRGNKSKYDAVLDSLCIESQVSIPSRNHVNSRNTLGRVKKSKKKKHILETDKKAQTGGVKFPSFLEGMKGLVNLYSAPMKVGYNAINSGINTIQNYRKKSDNNENESSQSKNTNESDIDDIEKAELEIKNEKTQVASKKRDEIVQNLSDNKKLDIKQVIKETSI
jgi:hypothetical protein